MDNFLQPVRQNQQSCVGNVSIIIDAWVSEKYNLYCWCGLEIMRKTEGIAIFTKLFTFSPHIKMPSIDSLDFNCFPLKVGQTRPALALVFVYYKTDFRFQNVPPNAQPSSTRGCVRVLCDRLFVNSRPASSPNFLTRSVSASRFAKTVWIEFSHDVVLWFHLY